MSSIINAWNIERSVAENTLDRIITERETGVLSTLLKANLLSHTIDMPLNMVVNIAVNAIMPTAMKLMYGCTESIHKLRTQVLEIRLQQINLTLAKLCEEQPVD